MSKYFNTLNMDITKLIIYVNYVIYCMTIDTLFIIKTMNVCTIKLAKYILYNLENSSYNFEKFVTLGYGRKKSI